VNSESQRELSISSLPISTLKPYDRNARTHTKHQIRQIAESIRVFGYTNPVLIDASGRIIAGHGRVEAAKLLGMDRVPTIRLENLTDEQIRAYMIADNKLAQNAGWDPQILAIEFQYLVNLESADFDVTITGFEIPEIDAVIAEVNQSSEQEPPVPEPDRKVPTVTQPGDVWTLDKHRIICGNSLHESTYRTLMGARRAAGAFTDPPFNVPIDGHATGNGAIRHREFAMASGEMSEAEFVSFLINAIQLLARYSTPNAFAYICSDWRHIEDFIRAAKQSYDQLANICVWVKDNGGMGSFYRSQHEFVAVFRKGKGPHRNNIQLGQFGRNRTNIWQYPGVQTMSKQGEEGNLLALHPTVKPIAMVADAILDSTARNEIVLDSFLGSGTTLMAAERVGRICHGIEIDPAYVDVAIRRWQNYTGEAAVHALTGKRFDEVAVSKEEARA
jgi:DNA modification methylase